MIISTCLLDGSIASLVEEIGFKVVGLDSCLGERSFNVHVSEKGDPLKSLARSYLYKPTCPRTMDMTARLEEVKKLVEDREPDGLIYFVPKFCDQASYDFRLIKDCANDYGIRVLFLDGEYGSGESGQVRTRVAAFRESFIL